MKEPIRRTWGHQHSLSTTQRCGSCLAMLYRSTGTKSYLQLLTDSYRTNPQLVSCTYRVIRMYSSAGNVNWCLPTRPRLLLPTRLSCSRYFLPDIPLTNSTFISSFRQYKLVNARSFTRIFHCIIQFYMFRLLLTYTHTSQFIITIRYSLDFFTSYLHFRYSSTNNPPMAYNSLPA